MPFVGPEHSHDGFDSRRVKLSNIIVDYIVRDLLPEFAATYNLGSYSLPWKSIYFAGDMVHLGDLDIDFPADSVVRTMRIRNSGAGGFADLDVDRNVLFGGKLQGPPTLIIDALDAGADSLVKIRNSDETYQASLEVEKDIIVGGLVDGVDVAAHAADANAHIDSLSDIPTRDHDLLTGLADDDHTQYLLTDGSRALGGSLLPSQNETYDLGSDSAAFKTLYVKGIDIGTAGIDSLGSIIPTIAGDIVLGTNTNDFLEGHIRYLYSERVRSPEFSHLGNITIDALRSNADSIIYIRNSDATYQASLDVEKDIIVGGLVDGVDVAAHAADANAHIDNLIDIPTRQHSDLQNVGPDDHHNRCHDHSDSADGNNLSPYIFHLPSNYDAVNYCMYWNGTEHRIYVYSDGTWYYCQLTAAA